MKEAFVLQSFFFLRRQRLSGPEKPEVSHWVTEPTEGLFCFDRFILCIFLIRNILTHTLQIDPWKDSVCVKKLCVSPGSAIFSCNIISHFISCLMCRC